MTTQRRVVRNSLQLTEERQTIAAGEVVLARATRDYADDIMARRLELWIETEVMMPDEHPRPGQPTVPWPAGTSEVVVLGTDRRLEPDAVWLASVDDAPLAWHVYRVAAEQWADEIDRRALVAIAAASAHRRRICGAIPDPGMEPAIDGERVWYVRCEQEPGHDPRKIPHRATGLGSHGLGEFAWIRDDETGRLC